jgi:hypothetical protein
MQQPKAADRDLVLVGRGHAHGRVLQSFGIRPPPGARSIRDEAVGIDAPERASGAGLIPPSAGISCRSTSAPNRFPKRFRRLPGTRSRSSRSCGSPGAGLPPHARGSSGLGLTTVGGGELAAGKELPVAVA